MSDDSPAMNPLSTPISTETSNWENSLGILIGAGLVAAGLAQRSKTGMAIATLGSGIAYFGYLTSEKREPVEHYTSTSRAITINRPEAEVFEFWTKPENLQRILPGVESIEHQPDGRWRWRLKPIIPANSYGIRNCSRRTLPG